MNFHSKNESTKTQVSETFFWKKKKKHRKSYCVEKRKKCSLWKLPSSISPTIYSVLTIIKPRDSAAGWHRYTYNASVPARELNLIVLQLRTSFVPFFLCHEWTGRYLFGKLFQQQKIPHFLFTVNGTAPGMSLLDNNAVNAIN